MKELRTINSPILTTELEGSFLKVIATHPVIAKLVKKRVVGFSNSNKIEELLYQMYRDTIQKNKEIMDLFIGRLNQTMTYLNFSKNLSHPS